VVTLGKTCLRGRTRRSLIGILGFFRDRPMASAKFPDLSILDQDMVEAFHDGLFRGQSAEDRVGDCVKRLRFEVGALAARHLNPEERNPALLPEADAEWRDLASGRSAAIFAWRSCSFEAKGVHLLEPCDKAGAGISGIFREGNAVDIRVRPGISDGPVDCEGQREDLRVLWGTSDAKRRAFDEAWRAMQKRWSRRRLERRGRI